jgi:hypothetical protein
MFSFHHTLTGPAPDSMGDILALYTLSHIAACYLSREGFPVIPLEDGIWRNAIRNQEHRQAFSSLVQTLIMDLTRTCSERQSRSLACFVPS